MPARVGGYPERRGPAIESPLLPGFVAVAAPMLDAASIIGSGLVARSVYTFFTGLDVGLETSVGVSLMLAVLFVMLMRGWGFYDPPNILALERQIKSAFAAWFLSLGVIMAFVFLLKAGHDISRGSIVVLTVVGLTGLVGQRFAWRAGLSKALSRGLVRRRTATVFSFLPWSDATPQLRSLKLAGVEATRRTFLPADADERAAVLNETVTRMRDEAPDEIVIVACSGHVTELEDLVARLRSLPVPVRLMPDAHLSRLALQPAKAAGRFALIDIKREPLGATELATKRALDIVVAGTALLAAAPLLVLAMAAVRLDAPGPVLFRQRRRGFNGRTFRILKLRTMSCLEDGAGIAQATRGDPRVTRVGEWLRRTSIDELPQLWNVLRGEMSIVGPRPHAVAHDSYYDPIIDNYAFRQHVKPGLTGWAQVNGHRGETPEVSMMAARVEHDVWYINNWSLFLDIRILFLTATRLLARTAY